MNSLAFLASGILASCLTLSTFIAGTFDEGNQAPEGSDSIQFENLTANDIIMIEHALTSYEFVPSSKKF